MSDVLQFANGAITAAFENLFNQQGKKEAQEHFGAVENAAALAGKDVRDPNGDQVAQCAELLKVDAGAPPTSTGWYQGTKLTPNNIDQVPQGTPIASGWQNGKYPNNSSGQHSGFLGPHDAGGYFIIEQYRGLDVIQSRYMPWNTKREDYFHNPNAYSTVKW